MADNYSATGEMTTVSGSLKTALSVIASTATRAKIYDYIFSAGGTPADNVLEFVVMRSTADGTGSAVTPALLDPASPAAQLTCKQTYTTEGTYTAASELLDFDLNQRATFRWVAAPGGELIVPATSANGIGD